MLSLFLCVCALLCAHDKILMGIVSDMPPGQAWARETTFSTEANSLMIARIPSIRNAYNSTAERGTVVKLVCVLGAAEGDIL